MTVFLSNDATAVVLTPAVFAAARAARAETLPYLLICAFIANAASFVLPISNPANLVVFSDGAMPPLLPWLARFGLPSMLAIVATYAVLRFTSAPRCAGPSRGISPCRFCRRAAVPSRSASAARRRRCWPCRGWAWIWAGPTCLAAVLTGLAVSAVRRSVPWTIVKGVSWAVLPLVAGLFVLVEGIGRTGLLAVLSGGLRAASGYSAAWTAWGVGAGVAVVCNLVNNLPAGLLAGAAIGAAPLPPPVAAAVLVGVDLGPNLSVTGSLATILWLVRCGGRGYGSASGSS